MDLHDALAAAELAGVAIGVAGAEGGHRRGPLCCEPAAIAGGLARLQHLDHADHGLELHHRAEQPEADFIAGVKAVQDDAGAGHAVCPGQALGPVRVEHHTG